MARQLGLSLPARATSTQTYLTSAIRYPLNFLAIPDGLEKAINTIIQNFTIGKNRAFVSRKTLELNKRSGGISMPNVKKIRQSYDIKFIKEILAGKANWLPILEAIFEKEYGNPLTIYELLMDDSTSIKRTLPSHITQALKTYRKYSGISTAPNTVARIAERSINMLTKSKTYAQADIHQIARILEPSQVTEPLVLKTHEALQLPRGTRATHRKLATKLPEPAIPKLLRRADRSIAIEITSSNEDGTYNAIEHPIQNDLILWNQHRYTRITKEDLNNCKEIAECPHTKKTRTDNLRNLADFEIKVNGFAIPLITYTTGKFNKTAAESTIHHHSTIWEDLNPQPEWQNILTRSRHPSIPVRIQNLRLKTMHNRLYLGPMMKYIVPNAEYDLTICPLCLEEDSPKHLFLSCQHADNLWRGLSNFLETISGGTITGLTDSEKLFGGLRNPDLEIRTIAEISIAQLQLTLWQSRLRYKHEGTRSTETELEIAAKAAIKHSPEITISAAESASYDIRRWKLTHEKATEFMRAMN